MLSLKKILAIFCSMILVLQLATCDMIQHCLNLFAWHMQSVISRHMAYLRKPEIEPDNRTGSSKQRFCKEQSRSPKIK